MANQQAETLLSLLHLTKYLLFGEDRA